MKVVITLSVNMQKAISYGMAAKDVQEFLASAAGWAWNLQRMVEEDPDAKEILSVKVEGPS